MAAYGELSGILEDGLSQLDLVLSDQQKQLLLSYVALLDKWNKHYNLTAIRDPQEMMIHHVLDALSVAKLVKAKQHLCDIGTGAGIPGLILAITHPHQSWVLLDGNGKKVRFLVQVVHELGLTNVKPTHSRAEQYQTEACFDGIISRAVGEIKELIDITNHLLCADGCWYAMKGQYPEAELSQLSYPVQVERLNVPRLEGERHLVTITR